MYCCGMAGVLRFSGLSRTLCSLSFCCAAALTRSGVDGGVFSLNKKSDHIYLILIIETHIVQPDVLFYFILLIVNVKKREFLQ